MGICIASAPALATCSRAFFLSSPFSKLRSGAFACSDFSAARFQFELLVRADTPEWPMRICPRCSELFSDDAGFCAFCGIEVNRATDQFLGRTIAGRFRLTKKLGSGGMSV